MPILSASNLSRTYRSGSGASVKALAPIDLSILSGERVAIVGPSGSGKSTLLGLLAGLDRPTTGEIVVDGQRLTRLTSKALAGYRRSTVGIVFQSGQLLPHLNAANNVALPLMLAGLRPRERAERVAFLLERVGLADRADNYQAQLSGGEQQRVAVARALANQPRLLLADEPTAGLDRETATTLINWLMELVSSEKLTLIAATHDLQLVARCTRSIQLDSGRLAQEAA